MITRRGLYDTGLGRCWPPTRHVRTHLSYMIALTHSRAKSHHLFLQPAQLKCKVRFFITFRTKLAEAIKKYDSPCNMGSLTNDKLFRIMTKGNFCVNWQSS